MVHVILGYRHAHDHEPDGSTFKSDESVHEDANEKAKDPAEDGLLPLCFSTDPCAKIDDTQYMAEVMEANTPMDDSQEAHQLAKVEEGCIESMKEKNKDDGELKAVKDDCALKDTDDIIASAERRAIAITNKEKKRLESLSLNTAIAICLHNFPEGKRLCFFFMCTYVCHCMLRK